MKLRRLSCCWLLPLVILATPSCTTTRLSDRDRDHDPAASAASDDPTIRKVLVATNRAPEPGSLFNGERSSKLRFAEVGMRIQDGARASTRVRPLDDPEKRIVPSASRTLDGEAAFRAELRKRVQASPTKTVAVFVHGYHSVFAEGVAFTTQLEHNSGYDGTSILFSWPSGGKWRDYVYDRDSIATSRDALERTIRIAAESGAEQVGIVAHSMGCLLTMEALRQAAIAGDATFGGVVRSAMLASPDISIDTFKSQLRKIGAAPRIAVLISRDDDYLDFSQFLAGRVERVGNYPDDKELAELGVVVIDLTDVGSNKHGSHYKFAEMPDLMGKIYTQMNLNPNAARPIRRGTSDTLMVATGKYAGVVVTTPFRILGNAFGNLATRR